MDVTNSAGRKISILNDEPPHLVRLPSFTPSLRSRTSSYTTSNYADSIGSPPTPQLIRSNSSDSMDNQTPSPITPDFGLDLHSPRFSQPGFFNTQHHQAPPPHAKDMESPYPMMNMAYNPSYYPQPSAANSQPPPQQQQREATAPAPSANGRPKKNQYPCPLAKQENCHDFFTTSGHAARHSKKHTGRKDAICPECNKAFTRKDNMEQHRRTHKGGRATNKASADRGAKKATTRAARPKISPTQSSTPVLSPTTLVDPALPISPVGSSFMGHSAQQSFLQQSTVTDQYYPDPTAFAMTGYAYSPAPPSSDHLGLDVLASAASDTRRFSP